MCGFAASFCQRRLIGAEAWPHYLLCVALGVCEASAVSLAIYVSKAYKAR